MTNDTMNTAELRLTFQPDDQGLGELYAVVRAGEFAGWGSGWFNRIHLKQTFIAALRAYPLDPNALPQTSDILENLRIAVSPFDSRGTLLVRIDVDSSSESAGRELHQTLTAHFLTGYSAIAEFAERLEKVLDGASKEAILKGFLR